VNKVVYVSDFLLSDILGGGELNDHELCNGLKERKVNLSIVKSHKLDLQNVNINTFYIISNFINLKSEVKDFITKKCKYIIYEHDHKYISTRNPANFKNYKAPESLIINKKFYQNAKLIYCQSSFHKSIIEKNINLHNIYNVSGNLWSMESLNKLSALSKKSKENCYSILNSRIPHKNTTETKFYCDNKGYKYQLISSGVYDEFLNKLSNNDKFIFLPKTPETLSRVVVEARMMNIKTITNKNVGASYEPWFSLKGQELIDFMFNKKYEILNKTIEIMNEK
tara:strand:+ start:2516 stop:3358 length:843 start_codon:yes stop_codon:yes gene_type:complete